MRLSSDALNLLILERIEALKKFPVTELLDARSNAELANLSDSEIDSLFHPVVVSNGEIFPRKKIEELFQTSTQPTCPRTKLIIRKNWMHELPLLKAALALRQLKKSLVVLEPATQATNSTTANLAQALTAAQSTNSINLTIQVSQRKIRATIKCPSAPLAALLGVYFHDKDNNITRLRPGQAYKGISWGLIWGQISNTIRLEFWFPKGQMNDQDINQIIAAMIAPLNLPPANTTPINPISIADIEALQYASALELSLPNLLMTGECTLAFLTYISQYRLERAKVTGLAEDTIIETSSTYTTKKNLGKREFCAEEVIVAEPSPTPWSPHPAQSMLSMSTPSQTPSVDHTYKPK